MRYFTPPAGSIPLYDNAGLVEAVEIPGVFLGYNVFGYNGRWCYFTKHPLHVGLFGRKYFMRAYRKKHDRRKK
jgi:hypothetical protein